MNKVTMRLVNTYLRNKQIPRLFVQPRQTRIQQYFFFFFLMEISVIVRDIINNV